MRMVRVLFVCTGNICRSPMAEAVLRKMVGDAELDARIECDSAGIEGYHVGSAPDPRAVHAASLRGYEMVELRARKLGPRDFRHFDLLVGMDSGHIRQIESIRPHLAPGKVARFLDFSPELVREHGPNVPDPYYGDAADFEYALDLIEQGSRGLLDAVRRDFP